MIQAAQQAHEEHLDHSSAHQFRSVLKELMYRHHITATELARRIDLPQPTVHRLLAGKTEDPKLSTLSIIAQYFQVSIDQLLGATPLEANPLNKPGISLSIPLISWENATTKSFTNKLNTSNWNDWFLIDIEASPHSFGLKTKPSMEPRFPGGSILTIDPNITPKDGDLVIVHYKNTAEATIREIILDGPKQLLRSIIADSSMPDELEQNIKIIGVVIQTRFSYK